MNIINLIELTFLAFLVGWWIGYQMKAELTRRHAKEDTERYERGKELHVMARDVLKAASCCDVCQGIGEEQGTGGTGGTGET